jgi:hypothetical protein
MRFACKSHVADQSARPSLSLHLESIQLCMVVANLVEMRQGNLCHHQQIVIGEIGGLRVTCTMFEFDLKSTSKSLQDSARPGIPSCAPAKRASAVEICCLLSI